MNINNFINTYQQRVENHLEKFLPSVHEAPLRLHQAMHYSTLNGGKRIRPLLVYALGHLLQIADEHLDGPAAAVEMIHCYSLIHDDLPAMDDDDLRRGKPTCHKAFDEATAILAGDALQALAFEVLVNYPAAINASQRLALIKSLASACGSQGMAGGQALDIEGTGQHFDASYVKNMHTKKTGALIAASICMPAHLAGLTDCQLKPFIQLGELVGLAFQIQDDILDIEGNTEQLGKQQGADVAADKLTYPAAVGLAAAKHYLQTLHDQALALLTQQHMEDEILVNLINLMTQRQN